MAPHSLTTRRTRTRLKTKLLRATRSINIKGWLIMSATLAVAGGGVAAASFFGGRRTGAVLAAAEATVLACRVRKAIVMRQVETGRKSKP